jgi:ribonuclease BN (tRNA processing enzyme)
MKEIDASISASHFDEETKLLVKVNMVSEAFNLQESWQGENWNVKVLFSRAGVATQILISTVECDVLVDVGDGVLRDLLRLGYDFERLEAIIITHGHFDHVGGLWALLGFLRMIGRTKDLLIIAPSNCGEVEKLVKSFTIVYNETMPFKIVLNELSDEEKVNIGKITVQAFPVIHRGAIKVFGVLERIPALGYSISYGKQRIVISGDTGFCQSLEKFTEGADLAILEATANERTAENSEIHLSIEEATEIGKTAKKFILIHKSSL